MKKVILYSVLTLSSTLMAQNLVVEKGIVKAHTEVFGDSSINPATKGITSHLKMGKEISSLHGSVDISIAKLKSDNSKRDEHMVEAIESKDFPRATYTFKNVKKAANGYLVDGILNFHGVKKPLQIKAKITQSHLGLKLHPLYGK